MTEVFLPNLVFAGLIVVGIRHVGDLRFLIGSYMASIAVLVYQCLFVWSATDLGGYTRATTTVMFDGNDLSVIFAAGLPLSLLMAQTSRGLPRIAAYACAAGIPAATTVLGSRGGLLALVAAALGVFVMMPGTGWGKRTGMLLAAVGAMAVAAPPGYFKQMQTILHPEDDYNVTSETGRMAIWGRGLENLKPRPMTGVGIGNFARAMWVNQAYTVTGQPIRAQSPHNTFLQVAVDLGVPAFLVVMSILYGAIVGIARTRAQLPRSWLHESAERRFFYVAASYLPGAFMGWSVGAFFVSHAYLVPFYVLVAFAAGFLYLLRRELSSGGRDPSAPRHLGMPTPRRDARV
jgi:O-antigen ligase